MCKQLFPQNSNLLVVEVVELDYRDTQICGRKTGVTVSDD